MIEITENGNFIDENKLENEEIEDFIRFLCAEYHRHFNAYKKMKNIATNTNSYTIAYACIKAMIRHKEDIVFTEKAIAKLNKKHKL